jgi:hypothetical protein
VNYLRMFATDPAERIPRRPRRPRGRRTAAAAALAAPKSIA